MSKLALITGASSGIGRAFAQRLAGDGYDLVVVGRQRDRLEELAASLSNVTVRPVAADLSTDTGVDAIAEVCASQPLTMLVNNAGVAHYMPIAELSADQARELVHVKVVAPTMLIRAAVPGMLARQQGTIINVSGMMAFSGPAPRTGLPGAVVYTGTLAHLVAMTQVLHEELKSERLRIQALCPGVVATEFHERQGMDLSAVSRMSAEDVVTASLRGLELGEVVCAPGVEQADLLQAVSQADLAAFGAQSSELATATGPAERERNPVASVGCTVRGCGDRPGGCASDRAGRPGVADPLRPPAASPGKPWAHRRGRIGTAARRLRWWRAGTWRWRGRHPCASHDVDAGLRGARAAVRGRHGRDLGPLGDHPTAAVARPRRLGLGRVGTDSAEPAAVPRPGMLATHAALDRPRRPARCARASPAQLSHRPE